MRMIPVSPSNLNAVGYDPDTQILRIEFFSGTYDYFDVPEFIFNQLLTADSKGKYHAAFIKNQYRYQKL